MQKTALITGGFSGLGKELALTLINYGVAVVVIDKVPKEKLDNEYVARLKKYIELDLSDLDATKSSIEQYFMTEQLVIDIFIINAFPRIFNDFIKFNDLEIIQFVNTAFSSHLVFANYFLKKMLAVNYGRIIIISSKSAIQGYSSGSLYCSLKAAWIIFHECLQKELNNSNKNVTITTICPDSFSDLENNKNSQYEYILCAIKKRVIKAISHKSSKLLFITTFKTKIILSLQILEKLIKLW